MGVSSDRHTTVTASPSMAPWTTTAASTSSPPRWARALLRALHPTTPSSELRRSPPTSPFRASTPSSRSHVTCRSLLASSGGCPPARFLRWLAQSTTRSVYLRALVLRDPAHKKTRASKGWPENYAYVLSSPWLYICACCRPVACATLDARACTRMPTAICNRARLIFVRRQYGLHLCTSKTCALPVQACALPPLLQRHG